MPRLIILEGPDRVGKTVQSQIIAERLGYKYLHQPSGSNILGFLREVVKYSGHVDAFARQLLHTTSHIVDAYEEFGGEDIIMDRSPMSMIPYSSERLKPEDIVLLMKIHYAVYNKILTENAYNTKIIFFRSDSPFGEADKSVYENEAKWADINARYKSLFTSLISNRELFVLSKFESYGFVDATQPVEDVTNSIINLIN